MIEIFEEDDRWHMALPDYEMLAKNAIEKLENLLLETPQIATIALINDADIQKLNAQFRAKDKPTNVLSFPAPSLPAGVENSHLGDIFIAFETMQLEAEQEQKPLAHHFQHLVIHGYLHLLGYDHESDQEAELMEGIEIEILKVLDIPNPYSYAKGSENHA